MLPSIESVPAGNIVILAANEKSVRGCVAPKLLIIRIDGEPVGFRTVDNVSVGS